MVTLQPGGNAFGARLQSFGTTTDVRLVWVNACHQIFCTESGMWREAMPVHALKACQPISYTESPRVSDVRPLHPWKAYYCPIVLTKAPRVSDVRASHESKTLSPISLTMPQSGG